MEYAFEAAIEVKDLNRAVEYGARIIPGYKMVKNIFLTFFINRDQFYGTEHPFLGIHLMKFGKLMIEINNGKEADEMLRVSFSC